MATNFIYTEARIMPKVSIASTISATSVGRLPIRPGETVRARDDTLGSGKFIWLPTVSAPAGTLVTYRENAAGSYTVAACPSTANLAQPVAVQMATGATNNYGWFQVEGPAVLKKITTVKVSPNVAIYISATAGSITSTAASGKQILGARAAPAATVASATSTVICIINNPHMQGQTS
jgi:hypothetical protein